MDSVCQAAKPSLEVGRPAHFKTGAVLAINFYGVFLGLPVLIAFGWVSFHPLDVSSYGLPVLAVFLAAVFLPFGFGNLHVRRLVGRFKPPVPREQTWIVQLATKPRLRTGPGATMEDADDLGYAFITDRSLVFFGDSARLEVPFASIQKIWLENVGLRGLFVYAPRICMTVAGLKPSRIEFADRSAFLLTTARRQTRRLYERLLERAADAQAKGSAS